MSMKLENHRTSKVAGCNFLEIVFFLNWAKRAQNWSKSMFLQNFGKTLSLSFAGSILNERSLLILFFPVQTPCPANSGLHCIGQNVVVESDCKIDHQYVISCYLRIFCLEKVTTERLPLKILLLLVCDQVCPAILKFAQTCQGAFGWSREYDHF